MLNGGGTAATLIVNTTGVNTYAGTLQDGTGGGALALIKAGNGTLYLGGAIRTAARPTSTAACSLLRAR